jgi:DMSO reductase family type II enzyme heme b subunit
MKRTKTIISVQLVGIFLISTLYSLLSASAFAQEGGLTPDQEAGKKVYDKWCANCHGREGAGDGPGADFFTPRPRDFTYGLYKIRSTGSGELPTDHDLVRIVTRGMPGTGMPNWDHTLKETEIKQVVQYIKTFSGKFARAEEPPQMIPMGKPPQSTPESIERGKSLFRELECFKCHGEEGRGDGPSAIELEDDWEYPIWPRNLTRNWEFRGGNQPENVFRRVIGGVAGTPMPSFVDSLDEAKAWDLAHYVLSLSPAKRPELRLVLKASRIEGELPGTPDDPLWEDAELSEYPLVGQVIKDPRLFTPTVGAIRVQAVYNDEAIALRLSWDDPTQTEPEPEYEVYEDAVAVQFPVERPAGPKRPYFLMGDDGLPVNLWKWGSEESAVVEQNAWGTGRIEDQPSSEQQLVGEAIYNNGRYQLVLKRSLATADVQGDVQFEPGKFVSMAFFVWDGFNGETGEEMAISTWYYLLLEPPVPAKVYVYPPIAVILAVGVQWWYIRRLRRGSGK